MKPLKSWQNWVSIDLLLMVLLAIGIACLLIGVAIIPLKANAGGCLFIDVPPGAVVNQPDGDTFHIFSFQPGGVIKIRVDGADTPETSKKKGVPDEPGAQEAKAFTKAWLAKGPFRVTTCGKPTIDRIVGKVERDGRTLAQDLIQAGHGKD